MSITDKIKEFSNAYRSEVNQKLSSQMISHRLLVNELPNELKSILEHIDSNLTVKGSIGQGNTTFYPWLGIFDRRVSTGATNGFDVVLLFSDDFEDLYLTLNQGSTLQSREQIEHYRTYVYSKYSTVSGFQKGRIPERGLVKTKEYTSNNKGRKYEETNIFYKKFIINELNEESFLSDLENILKVYVDCASSYGNSEKITNAFTASGFYTSTISANLKFNNLLVARFIASLITKPFVILTGLSGSGKTKLAQAFVQWICAHNSQYRIIPVGADWTNREPLLGFPSALEPGKYIKPENGALDLILEASKLENTDKPYFLVLDEMNLSHVERYFADFLSAMESGEAIPLHPDGPGWKDGNGNWNDGIPDKISLPRNTFILGTVNIDETTYMFSPKVLDRASVIEFRITEEEMKGFMANPLRPDLGRIKGLGAGMASEFLKKTSQEYTVFQNGEKIQIYLNNFFSELKKVFAEFGYRSASEIFRFSEILPTISEDFDTESIIDAAVIQKLLPKLHGSRKKLEPVLKTLAGLCLYDVSKTEEIVKEGQRYDYSEDERVRFPLSFEKIIRMYHRAVKDGFTSFAEA